MSIRVPEWSVHRYKLFKNCPWAYYKQYELKEEQRKSAGLEVSKATRLALKEIVLAMLKQGGSGLSNKDVITLTESACQKHLTRGLHPKKVVTEIKGWVNIALAQFDLSAYEMVVPEKWLTIPLDKEGHFLRSKVDLFLVMENGMLYLIDYTTGAIHSLENDVQLATNAAVARVSGYDVDILGGVFFLRKGELVPAIVSKEQSDKVLEMHREAIKDVEQRLRYIFPELQFPATPGSGCQYCSYSGECPAIKKLDSLPHTVDELTPEKVKSMGEWFLAASRSFELIGELLREYCDKQDDGIIQVNGGYFYRSSTESAKWRLGDVIEKLKVLKADDAPLMNVWLSASDLGSFLTAKKHADVAKALKAISHTTIRSLFGYYTEKPAKPAAIDEEDEVA